MQILRKIMRGRTTVRPWLLETLHMPTHTLLITNLIKQTLLRKNLLSSKRKQITVGCLQSFSFSAMIPDIFQDTMGYYWLSKER